MTADSIQPFLLVAALKCMYEFLHGILPVILVGAALWLSWYVWRFVLSPALYPDEPRQLPYWIPFVGHAKCMLAHSNRPFSYGREYFGNSLEVFSITVMGQELYIVVSPADVLSVYKKTKELDFNPVIKDIMSEFGVSLRTLEKMFQPGVEGKSWMDLCHYHFKVQMHPGQKLEALQKTFLGNIDSSLNMAKLSGSMVSTEKDEKVVSLYKWCGDVLVDSATRAFFGDSIYQVAPDLLQDFFVFDNESWRLSYKYPEFAAKAMYAAKAKGEDAFRKYLALPKEHREDASWIVDILEQGMSDLGIEEEHQKAPMLFILYRLINTNAYKLCFWCLAYLLYDEPLLSAIKSEIQPAFQQSGSLDMSYLLHRCPLLTSLYEEILRLANAPIGTRVVVAECNLGGKLLRPGHKLLMPYRQMHCNPQVFGANAAQFDAERFLRNEGLVRNTSYRPFGGAATHCPGRFLARRDVYMFVALLLRRFDLSLYGKDGKTPRFPRMDETIPSGGMMGPAAGDDVIVRVRMVKH